MKLAELARVPGATLDGDGEIEITGIEYDSRRVKPGDLFVAVTGIRADGHVFIQDALVAGAAAVAVQGDAPAPAGVSVVRLQSSRTGLAELASEFNGRPSRRL